MRHEPIGRYFLNAFGVAALLLLLWPIAYSAWISFTPGEILVPPGREWSLRWYPAMLFRRITLPLIAAALLAGAIMGFVLSLNEFMIALFLTTPEIETLPRVIWPKLRDTLSPVVAAASCVTTLITLLGLALVVAVSRAERFLRHLLHNEERHADAKTPGTLASGLELRIDRTP